MFMKKSRFYYPLMGGTRKDPYVVKCSELRSNIPNRDVNGVIAD
jgi:hypothetical protein